MRTAGAVEIKKFLKLRMDEEVIAQEEKN